MFCGRCGNALVGEARFCAACGAAVLMTQAVPGYLAGMRLERPRTNRVIAGVCAGLARHYRWDLTWVRVLTVLITVFSSGAGLVAYIVFWIVMPEELWMLPAPTGTAAPPPAS